MNPPTNRFPMLIHEVPLHDVKVGVWCAVSATKIIKSFFSEALNSGHFLTLSDCDSSFFLVLSFFCLHSLQDFCVV